MLANALEAKTANGLILLFASIANMDIAKRGRVASLCTLSVVKPLGSLLKKEADLQRKPPKAKHTIKKDGSGDSQQNKNNNKNKKDKKGVLARMVPISCVPLVTAGE